MEDGDSTIDVEEIADSEDGCDVVDWELRRCPRSRSLRTLTAEHVGLLRGFSAPVQDWIVTRQRNVQGLLLNEVEMFYRQAEVDTNGGETGKIADRALMLAFGSSSSSSLLSGELGLASLNLHLSGFDLPPMEAVTPCAPRITFLASSTQSRTYSVNIS